METCLRSFLVGFYLTAWCIFGALPRFLESLIVVPGNLYVLFLVEINGALFFSNIAIGICLAGFLSWMSGVSGAASNMCAAFSIWMCYLLGASAMSAFFYVFPKWRYKAAEEWPSLRTKSSSFKRRFFTQLGDAGYVGLFTGLTLGLAIITVATEHPSVAPTRDDWCYPVSGSLLPVVILMAVLWGALATSLSLPDVPSLTVAAPGRDTRSSDSAHLISRPPPPGSEDGTACRRAVVSQREAESEEEDPRDQL